MLGEKITLVIRIKKRSLKRIAIIVISFLYIFYPPFTKQSTLYFLAVIAYGYVVFHRREFKSFLLDKRMTGYISLLIISEIYLALIALLHGMDGSFLIEPLREIAYFGIIALPICFVICNWHKKSNQTIEDFFNTLFVVGNIQGFFSIISFTSPAFHQWVLQRYINYGYDANRYISLSNYRLYGLAFHLTNFAPMVAALLIDIALIYARKNIKYLFYVPLMFAFVLLNSRTAIVLVVMGVLFVLIVPDRTVKGMLRGVGITLLIVLGMLFSARFISSQSDTWYGGWVQYGLRTVMSFFVGERIGYAEYITDSSIWKIPINWELLVGYGNSNLYYHTLMQTDVGYIHYLWKGGIAFAVMVWLINSKLIKPLIKDTILNNVGIIIAAFVIIGNIKDTIYSVNEFMMLLLLIFSANIMLEREEKIGIWSVNI